MEPRELVSRDTKRERGRHKYRQIKDKKIDRQIYRERIIKLGKAKKVRLKMSDDE